MKWFPPYLHCFSHIDTQEDDSLLGNQGVDGLDWLE